MPATDSGAGGTDTPLTNAQPLGNKKPPKPSKYTNVKSRVDTGFNEKRLEEQFDLSKLNVRFRRTENFRRIKPGVFASLFRQEGETGVDYLLLDLRDQESFNKGHIRGAEHYPAQTLRRAMNNFTSSILAFANKEPERIIVIYDDDERTAVPTANLFYEKAVDNVFIITGGLRALAKEYPELVDGEVPEPPSPPTSKRPPPSTRRLNEPLASVAGSRPASSAGQSTLRSSNASTLPTLWR